MAKKFFGIAGLREGGITKRTSLSKTLSFGVLALLAGCAASGHQALTPATLANWSVPPPYVLHPGDEVEVKFYYSPQLNEREFIGPNGSLTLPLLPSGITAAGLTVDELHDELVKVYKPVLVQATIEVVLRTAVSDRVYVGGEVALQGPVELAAPTTVSEALFLAQGLKPTAYKSQVLVIRRLGDGAVATRVVNYNDAVSGIDPSQDVTLAAGDVVFVPESPIAKVDDFVTQYIRDALPAQTNFGISYQFGQPARIASSTTTTTTTK